MENQVSIIINGVRYDAVEIEGDGIDYPDTCSVCELSKSCYTSDTLCGIFGLNMFQCFKKSDKKFEV